MESSPAAVSPITPWCQFSPATTSTRVLSTSTPLSCSSASSCISSFSFLRSSFIPLSSKAIASALVLSTAVKRSTPKVALLSLPAALMRGASIKPTTILVTGLPRQPAASSNAFTPTILEFSIAFNPKLTIRLFSLVSRPPSPGPPAPGHGRLEALPLFFAKGPDTA